MTNRRRSGKGRTTVSKKADSPDKQTRKVNRRSRRNKKSESPERPEEVGSDYSGEELEDGHKRLDEDGENENYKEGGNQFDSGKSNEEQRAQAKEEESGGSDGSWKVKSENGGGGGIPKLKLCLTRPPEMSSPTSTSEQNPSPRRRRRSGRGNTTPTKEDEQIEELVVEECTKRITRNQKAKEIQEQEVASEPKEEESPEKEKSEEKEVSNSTNVIYNQEEDETRIAVESICIVEPPDESQTNMVETIQVIQVEEPEEDTRRVREEREEVQPVMEENSEPPPEENMSSVEMISVPPVEETQESVQQNEKDEVQETQEEPEVQQKKEQEIEPQKKEQELEPQKEQEMEPEKEQEEKEPQEEQEEEPQKEEKEESKQVEPEVEKKPEPEPEPEPEAEPEPKVEQEAEVETIAEKRRSSSRDSSEERAKEAALRSRNKNKKKEETEDGEVTESSGSELIRNTRSMDKSKTSSPIAFVTSENDRKENFEEPTPAKSGARKRRWGSSTSRTSKKPSVSISTDFLKEIIPEVKPLLMSEVQLSPNEEDEEGQLKDSEENLPVPTKKVEKEKMMQSDESEKDYEEEAVESGMEETTQTETAKPITQVKEKEHTTFTRKVSVMSLNERLQKSPSPPRHKPSNILYITNLVRPFTIPQLRELLARTGTITEDGFWIDKIKSKCYVKYETEDEAKATRHALHGVRWPVSNPKQLNVDFGTEAAMKAAMEGNEIATKRPIPSLFDKPIDLKGNEKTREKERDKSGDRRERSEKDKKERGKHREEDKREESEEDKDKKSRPPVEPLVRDRTVRRVTMPIREWDVGKNEDGFSPPPDGIEFSRHRDDRYERRVEYDRDKRDDYEDRRRRDKDRSRRSVSGEPTRKSKKKSEEEAPAKLLDDLFRKTKATPCIYWLPLTPEQISVKEEMRRKHMAEHEKKVAELRKMQREQNKRSSDKRRRRTRSRSRSRSTKK